MPLFNPRRDAWDEHFHWQDALLAGQTASGRATIDVLRINSSERVAVREILNRAGLLDLD